MPREVLPALRRWVGGEPERKSLAARVMSMPLQWVSPGQPYAHDWNVQRAVDEGYKINPYIFRAVEAYASAEGDRDIVFREGHPKKGRVIPAGELSRAERRTLRVFNRQSNPWEVSRVFRHRLIANYLLSSRGVFIEAVRSQNGGLWGTTILDADRVEMIAGEKQPVSAFRIQLGTTAGNGAGYSYLPPFDPKADPAEQPSGVVWVRSPHPTMLTRGMSAMEAAGMSADLDRHAREYNRRFLDNDGRPGGFASVEGPVDDLELERIQAHFMGGPDGAGRPLVVEAGKLHWQDTSATVRDTSWGDTMDRMRRDVEIAFGTPESVLGNASGRTFDNADAEYGIFWELFVGPLLSMLDAQLDILSPGGIEDDRFLVHDTDDVYVLGRHKRAEEDRAMTLLNAGVITIDEFRTITGREPWDVPGTRVLWIPQGRAALDDGEAAHDGDAKAAAEAPVLGIPAPVDPAEAARQGALAGSAEAAYNAQTNSFASSIRGDAAFKVLPPAPAALPAGTEDGEGEQRGARDEGGAGGWR